MPSPLVEVLYDDWNAARVFVSSKAHEAPPYTQVPAVVNVESYSWMVRSIAEHGNPVPWYDSPDASALVHAVVNTLSADAPILPSFFTVRFAEPESPGFLADRLNSWSQPLLL